MITEIETDPRHGLQVKRYHTWPVLLQQSTGEHSAQVMRIMLAIWPEAPRHVLIHCLMHDIPEMVGDLPYPMKKNDMILKDRMNVAELRVHRKMSETHMLPLPIRLTDEEVIIFKFCDNLEMWEHCVQERNMGNRYATVMYTRMLLAASTLLGRMPAPIRERAQVYMEIRKEQEGRENV